MSPTPAPVSVADTDGALLCGGLVSFWLYGLQTLQAYSYFKRFPNDRFTLKALVVWLMTIDTIHTAFTGHMLYYFLITEEDQAGMRPKAWSFNTNIALTGLIGFTCQLFLARRAWILNRTQWHRFLASGVAILALLPLACTFACTTIMVIIRHPALYAHCTIIIGTWLASTAFVDVVLASYLAYTLHGSRTGISRTDHILDRVIKYTLHTAVLTAGLALADLGTFYALGNVNLIHWAINLLISKTFVNTLLASLNSRSGHNETITIGSTTKDISFGSPFRSHATSNGMSDGTSVSTDTVIFAEVPVITLNNFEKSSILEEKKGNIDGDGSIAY